MHIKSVPLSLKLRFVVFKIKREVKEIFYIDLKLKMTSPYIRESKDTAEDIQTHMSKIE